MVFYNQPLAIEDDGESLPFPPPELGEDAIAGSTFFRVASSFPERRILAHALHYNISRHCVHVFGVGGNSGTFGGDNIVDLAFDYSKPRSLDLIGLFGMAESSDIFKQVLWWRFALRAHVSLRVDDDTDRMLPMLHDRDESALALLDASDHATDDWHTLAIFAKCTELGAIVGMADTASFEDHLSSFGVAALNRLVTNGFLRQTLSEFGDQLFQLDVQRVRWHGQYRLTMSQATR